MKKVFALILAAVVTVSAASVFADGMGCCAAKSASAGCCKDELSKLNLTDAQKAKVAALKDDMKRAVSTSEARAMFSEGLAKILTPEQFAQMKSQCSASKASGECPFMKSQKKS